MIELILKFYKKKVTSQQLIFRFMKIRYELMRMTFLLFMISILPLIYSLFLNSVSSEYRIQGIVSLIFFIFILLILIFLVSSMNKKAKKIAKQRYNINPNGWSWRTPDFEELQIELMREYLKKNHLYTENKIKLLILGLEKDIEKNKLPSLVNPGIFISLFVPIWIQYLTFRYKMITTEEHAISMLLFSALLILIIIIFVNFLKRASNELKELFLVDDSMYKKMLLEKLEDTLLRYNDEEDL